MSFERGRSKGFPPGVLRARESSVMARESPLSSISTLFQNLLSVASAPMCVCQSNEDKDACQDLRFVAVGGVLPSGVTADANVRDGHMDLCGVQRRVNLQACGILSLNIVTATVDRISERGPLKPGSVLPARVVS